MSPTLLLLALSACTWVSEAEFEDAADRDGDGYVSTQDGGDDCNDNDATIHPGAEEFCDEADRDCDGSSVDNATDALVFRPDDDQDGYAAPDADSQVHCLGSDEIPAGWVADNTDCDDTNAEINPGQQDVCNDIDDDCDDEIDEDAPVLDWFPDSDSDGFGEAGSTPTAACDGLQPDDTVANAQDCDDTKDGINPNADDVCDGVNNDCDSETDEDATFSTWYYDDDGDEYGDPDVSIVECEQQVPDKYVDNDLDCFDNDPNTVQLTFWHDFDTDGFGDPNDSVEACEAPSDYVDNADDCNDNDVDISPNDPEICEDGIDNDCSGDETGCGLVGSLDFSEADYTALVGNGTCIVQDVTGDGLADVMVAAEEPESPPTPDGWLAVGAGPNSIDLMSAHATFDEQTEGGYAPRSVLGDPTADLLFVLPGAVNLYEGGTGLSGAQTSAGKFKVDGLNGTTRRNVDTGDADCDSLSLQVAIGDWRDETVYTEGGWAGLFDYSAGSTVLFADAYLEVVPTFDYQNLGRSLRLGDLDGDSCNELMISASGTQGSDPSEQGGVYIFDGSRVGTFEPADADYIIDDSIPGSAFGYTTQLADLNGDNQVDLLVGSPFSSTIGAAAWLGPITGNENLGNSDLLVTRSGGEVAVGIEFTLGDYNGDGDLDLAIGGFEDTGSVVYIVLGPLSGEVDITTDSDGVIRSDTNGDSLATRLTTGDLDGDGFDDLMATGQSGKVRLFYGSGG